ncbi:hypothetical protein Dpoa2040_003076 [Dickeya sp. CFBP 2040]|uniref:RipA family octameric membrane protein n=1 Tax=Dickeya sp. CFBP 2040 TaxID=2718531 RepID=UPI0014467B2A|nr:hypothetical protein [Dickeya sp. CFBP 2040]NKI75762.1 hypothetical protein [Dickeya sp. CFBP 2040]
MPFNILGRNVSKNLEPSGSEKKNSDIDPFVNEYFNSNKPYFNALLGSRVTHKKTLSNTDIIVLREAYDKAHTIRNIEIDLYWKRATYCWTLIAALLTICGLLLSVYFKPEVDNRDEKILFVIGAFAILGVFVTIICQSIVRSGEYWKKNWETHISMLEPLFSGRIYSTHLISDKYRLSIAKLNLILLSMIYLCWLTVVFILLLIIFNNDQKLYLLSAISFFIPFMTILLLITITTASKNKDVNVFISCNHVHINKKPSTRHQAWEITKRTLKTVLIASILLTSLYTGAWLFFKYGMNINIPSLGKFINEIFDQFTK